MLADPIVIPIQGTGTSLYRVDVQSGLAKYGTADGLNLVQVRQSTTKTRVRREFRLTTDKLSADPLNPAVNVPKSSSVYLVVDEPIAGFTDTELSNMIASIAAAMVSYKTDFLIGQY